MLRNKDTKTASSNIRNILKFAIKSRKDLLCTNIKKKIDIEI